ncbi:septal ring lytic transglycosylase RlpA family protein [Spartinivicinus poritis]|uniref:Endolytic peptidoglycan transglycosylase RlpA n=1 Tax=Spartinivicinus poritis TaxID=2994640 RepID=A0ABT5U666_9GAMM|nr:septal ring lytic transglycosylase RlpA family protein [Spartinivicinus sp. A2-2]MDE1461858.1 septal ring lytic transglycosylase RlpA family protein [Spartinivicinus sp. A2-2]
MFNLKKNSWFFSVLSIFVLWLAGCTFNPSIEKDGAPKGDFDAAKVPDAVPRPHYGKTKSRPYKVLGVTYNPLKSATGYTAKGVASWYGTKFHGKKTALGETYNMYGMSAAHRTLPLPSYAKVTNLDNGKSVVVRVNDRGPFVKDRLIDLSYAAAKKLGYQKNGTARVKVEGIVPPQYQAKKTTKTAPAKNLLNDYAKNKRMYLQVAAFSKLESAQALKQRLHALTKLPVTVLYAPSAANPLHRVRIGPISDAEQLEQLRLRIANAKLGSPHVVLE